MNEPVTALTDFLLATFGWWCAWKLRQPEPKIELSRRLWAWGLGVQGAGALAGGLFHAFLPRLDFAVALLLWEATLILLGLATTLLVGGLGVAVLPPKVARIFLAVLTIKLAAYVAWAWPQQSFFPALCDQALALGLLLFLLALGRRRVPSLVLPILLGLAAVVLGGLIQYFKLGLGQYLNHNDIYHLFGGLALWCFYRLVAVSTIPSKDSAREGKGSFDTRVDAHRRLWIPE